MLATLMAIALAAATPTAPTSPAVAPRSPRSLQNPLSQTSLTPIAPTPCALAQPNCRRIDFFDLRNAGGNLRVEINRDLNFITSGRLLLLPGESLVIKFDGDGAPVVQDSGLAAQRLPESFISGVTRQLAAAGSGTVDRGAAMELPAERDTVRLSFIQLPGSDATMLVAENGYGSVLTYAANMQLTNGQAAQTSTCPVLGGIFSVEHWPHPIASITLADLKLTPLSAAGELTCR